MLGKTTGQKSRCEEHALAACDISGDRLTHRLTHPLPNFPISPTAIRAGRRKWVFRRGEGGPDVGTDRSPECAATPQHFSNFQRRHGGGTLRMSPIAPATDAPLPGQPRPRFATPRIRNAAATSRGHATTGELRVAYIFCVQHVARMSGRLISNFGGRSSGPIHQVKIFVSM